MGGEKRVKAVVLPDVYHVLLTLVDTYIANRGHPRSEFIACITPPHASKMTPRERKKSPTWKMWDDARRCLGEYVVFPDTPAPRRKNKKGK